MPYNSLQSQFSLEGEFTRGSGTGAYAPGRVISDGNPIKFKWLLPVKGKTLLISEISVLSSNPLGGLKAKIHIFPDVPASSTDDAQLSTLETTYNAVVDQTDPETGEAEKVIETKKAIVLSIDITEENRSVASVSYSSGPASRIIAPSPSLSDKTENMALWALIETKSEYTPIANEVFTIRGWGYVL